MLRVILWWVCLYLILVLGAGCAQQRQQPGPKAAVDENPLDRDVPIKPSTFYAAGELLSRQGHLAEAAGQFQKAIEADPEFVEAYNQLALLQTRLGRHDEARATFEKALALAPRAAYLHNNLGFHFLARRQYRDAEAAFRSALSVDPGFTRAKANLGIVLARQQRYDDALQCFLDVCPPPEANFNLAVLCRAMGDHVRAEGYYRRALQLKPDFVQARDGLERTLEARKTLSMIAPNQDPAP